MATNKDLLTSYNGSGTLEYDNYGNPKKWFKHGANNSSLGYTLQWGHVSNLIAITDNDAGKRYTYKYNDQGIRTVKVVNGVVHKYYLQGEQIIAERYGGSLIKFYYDSTGVCGFRYYNKEKDGDNSNGTDYYYQKNIQGDILRIFDKNDNLKAEYSYDAWGKCTIKTNVSGIATINPFRYRGYYLDDETGLYYLNARYYDPEISRFISPDSTDYLDTESINGLNLYAYGGNISDNFIFQNTFNKHYRSNNVNLNKKIKSNNRQTTVSYSGKNSHVYMVHKTISLIQNKVIAGVLGNFSYTHTRQLNVAGALYTYSNYGNSGISYGIGINVSDWLGISGYYSNNLGVGVGVQITPWITVGAEVSLFEGITISGGIINGNDTYEISVSVGWGTIVGYMIASGLAVSPIPGGRILGGLVALVTFLFV